MQPFDFLLLDESFSHPDDKELAERVATDAGGSKNCVTPLSSLPIWNALIIFRTPDCFICNSFYAVVSFKPIRTLLQTCTNYQFPLVLTILD